MEKTEKAITPQSVSPTPSEHQGETYIVAGDVETNGELKRTLFRRLIHVSVIRKQ